MTCQCVAQLQQKAASVVSLRWLLDVSRSGYYAARRRARQPGRVCVVTPRLKAALAEPGRSYGSRRLRAALRGQEMAVSRYQVRALMRINNLRPAWKRKFIHTTDRKHALPIADNALNRQFQPDAANRAWVADITYIRTRSDWCYLVSVQPDHIAESR